MFRNHYWQFIFWIVAIFASTCVAEEFDIVVYNVENLFDMDGRAVFDDYAPPFPGAESRYTPGMLLKKLDCIARVLATVDNGSGPDIVAFQEFERDLTPGTTVTDIDAFLDEYSSQTVAELLTPPLDDAVKGLPIAPLLAKRLEEEGLGRYRVSLPAPTRAPSGRPIAHECAVFSRFPILYTKSHSLPSARELHEVCVSVQRRPLVILNNHWKSGASDPGTESTRVENARVVRHRLDEIMAIAPTIDVLVVGDLNSHYDQRRALPSAPRTGIDEALGSQGDEVALLQPEKGHDLYNLWYELPPTTRYSEIWRGHQSTLMHILATPGLYDGAGVDYVDNSFRRLFVPGVNVDELGRPVSWYFGLGGGGGSDHLPVAATLRVCTKGESPLAVEPPSWQESDPEEAYPVRWVPPDEGSHGPPVPLSSGADQDDDWWHDHVGRLVAFEGPLMADESLSLKVGTRKIRIDVPRDQEAAGEDEAGSRSKVYPPGAIVRGKGILFADLDELRVDVVRPDWLVVDATN